MHWRQEWLCLDIRGVAPWLRAISDENALRSTLNSKRIHPTTGKTSRHRTQDCIATGLCIPGLLHYPELSKDHIRCAPLARVDMAGEGKKEIQLEIGHVLFIDLVGY